MASNSSPYAGHEYTIGWICLRPAEVMAARYMLDWAYGDPQILRSESDQNEYLLGRIGGLEIVIGWPSMDWENPGSATTVAKGLLLSFPHIKLVLLVGIGSGVPSYEGDNIRDIRLGDVVIGGDAAHGGLVAYDYEVHQAPRKCAYVLDKQHPLIRAAASRLAEEHSREGAKFSSTDQLFRAGYGHIPGTACAKCDLTQLVRRHPERRLDSNPVVHFGTIATGSSTSPCSPARDAVSHDGKAICLDMQAAGLMPDLPCVIIRGISDYADSHKNDQWSSYAANVAAACAKELLKHIEFRNFAIIQWLTPIDCATHHQDLLRRREPGSFQWLLNSTEFQNWLDTKKLVLCCTGDSGVGKTVFASTATDYLYRHFHGNSKTGIAYAYCDFQHQGWLSIRNMLLSLLKQLAESQAPLHEMVKGLYHEYKEDGFLLPIDRIFGTLSSVISSFSRVFIVIDGLDELQVSDHGRYKFLSVFSQLQNRTRFNLLLTLRPKPLIIKEIARMFKSSASIQVRATKGEMEKYLRQRLSHGGTTDANDHLLQKEFKAITHNVTKRGFLFAKLYLNLMSHLPSEHLKDLPAGPDIYEKVYEAMMAIIDKDAGSGDSAKRILGWITFAKRPLTISELQHALEVKIGERILRQRGAYTVNYIVSVCKGFVMVDERTGTIQLAHSTAREYLQSHQQTWFAEVEQDIATSCITYLLLADFKTGPCTTQEELEGRLQRYPLYRYASQNWGHHARQASEFWAQEYIVLNLIEDEAKLSASIQAMMATIEAIMPVKIHTQMRALHVATYFGLNKIVKILLEKRLKTDYNPNAEDTDGWTPLLWAVAGGHHDIIQMLVAMDTIDPDHKDINGRTPLSLAAGNGDEVLIKILLETNRVNAGSRDYMGRTPLTWAAIHGNTPAVRLLLLTRGVDLNCEDYMGRVPLSWAIDNGHDEVVDVLLQAHGLELNSADSKGRTPLSLAAIRGNEKAVERIIRLSNEHGMQETWSIKLTTRLQLIILLTILLIIELFHSFLQDRGWGGLSSVQNLLQLRSLLSLLGLIINNSKAIKFEGFLGWGPLSFLNTDLRGHTPKKVGLDSKDHIGQTPLALASEHGHEGIVKILLDTRRVNLESVDSDGWRPSWMATIILHKPLYKLLSILLLLLHIATSLLFWEWTVGVARVILRIAKSLIYFSLPKTEELSLRLKIIEDILFITEWIIAKGLQLLDISFWALRVEIGPLLETAAVVVILLSILMLLFSMFQLSLLLSMVLSDDDNDQKNDESKDESRVWTILCRPHEIFLVILSLFRDRPKQKLQVQLLRMLDGLDVPRSTNVNLDDDVDKQLPTLYTDCNLHSLMLLLPAIVFLLLSLPCFAKPKVQTPLSHAANNGYEKIVDLLIKGKSDPTRVSNGTLDEGQTPMWRAAKNGHESVVKLLLATDGVIVNSKELVSGLTPLMIAIQNGHDDVVKLLLDDARINVNSEAAGLRTAVSIAMIHRRQDMEELLRAKGGYEGRWMHGIGPDPVAVYKYNLIYGRMDLSVRWWGRLNDDDDDDDDE
ncbi:Ankyrin repeat domain-containing protein 50 [Cladobotryum mycophilum]|uniref:Ankyrin repeat domain-containing protein 50 n=1 Tax=Cladobotryum mycophilum TaxID=491253 RepID=A0ABR0S9X1_9HYPO